MFEIIILIFAFIIYFTIIRWNNTYTIAVFFDIVSMTILIFVLNLYINFVTGYQYHTIIEYALYKFINVLNISFFSLKTFVNIAILMFLLSNSIIAIKSNVVFREKSKYIWYIGIFALLSGCILYFNSEHFSEYAYIQINDSASSNLLGTLVNYIIAINNVVIMIFCIFPVINVLIRIKRTQLVFKKKYYRAIFLNIIAIDAGMLYLLYLTPLKTLYNNFDIYNFKIVNSNNGYDTYFNLICFLLIIFLATSLNLIKCNVVKMTKLMKKFIKIDGMLKVGDIRHIFHTYKNAMFSIVAISDIALNSDNADEIKQTVKKIKSCANKYAEHVGEFLNIGNNKYKAKNVFRISECIFAAEAQLAIPNNIRIIINIEDVNDVIIGNFQDITQVFNNLISNSIESINKKGESQGRIIIKIWNEENLVCVYVEDNGIGINKNIIKKIFAPFYTTKQSNRNWGFGLSHVKSVIDFCDGNIDVISTEGVYAKIQLAIPLYHGKTGDEN